MFLHVTNPRNAYLDLFNVVAVVVLLKICRFSMPSNLLEYQG